MLDPIRYIRINPAAALDMEKMNIELKSHQSYVDGLAFTHHEVVEGNFVQFFYDLPDGLSAEQENSALQAIREVHGALRLRLKNDPPL